MRSRQILTAAILGLGLGLGALPGLPAWPALAQAGAEGEAAFGQRAFASPEAAAAALVAAIEARDPEAQAAILGPDFAALITAQGGEANEDDRERFLAAAREAVVVRPAGRERVVLELGLVAWPMPAPLVRGADGAWRFDGAAGVEAVRDRIVGRNELHAIDVLNAYVEAQRAYAATDPDGDEVHAFAQRLTSSPGRHDGLYWPVAEGTVPSPLGPYLAAAGIQPDSRDPATPYYGYYFRILTRQGPNVPGGAYDYVINGNMIAGFAMVAWPADYGESGVMTFVVNQSGKVLERDMGPETDRIGPEIRTYDPDKSWLPAEG